MQLIPEPPSELKTPVLNVVQRCVAAGETSPPWIAVDDGSNVWSNEAARRPAAERCSAVVMVRTEAALLRAHQLGFGGAAWLPPSTPGLAAAFVAAARVSTLETSCLDLGLHDLASNPPPELSVVTVVNRGFWHWQLGDGVVTRALGELAEHLGCFPTVFNWPAVLLGGRAEAAIQAAWSKLHRSRPHFPQDPVLVVSLRPDLCLDPAAIVPSASAALAAAEARPDDPANHRGEGPRSIPVFSLPDGRPVGRWQCCSLPDPDSDRWLATPLGRGPRGYRWRLHRPDGRVEMVDEVSSSAEIEAAAAAAVLRVPGWITHGLRPASPAGLLVERLLIACRLTGATLWLSNIDVVGLRMLLGLGAPVLVDGPAVPRP